MPDGIPPITLSLSPLTPGEMEEIYKLFDDGKIAEAQQIILDALKREDENKNDD